MLIFLDTETTGTKKEDRLIQLAYKTPGEDEAICFNKLFKPPLPIKFTAMAIHHITQDMVEQRESFESSQDRADLIGLLSNTSNVMVAHNADFDVAILKKEGVECPRVVCTFKLSCYFDKDGVFESYSEQYLRYRLGLDVKALAHDAWGDILVLEKLYERLAAKGLSIEEMIEISSKPALIPRIKFGKHRGMLFREIPKSYLGWLVKQDDMDENVKYSAQYWLDN